MNLSQSVLQLVLAVAGGGAVTAIITGIFAARRTAAETSRTGADATKVLTDAAAAMVEPMQRRITAMACEMDKSRSEATELREGLIRTRAELSTTRTELGEAHAELRQIQELVEEMSGQLRYYRDKYGPPSDGRGFPAVNEWDGRS